MNVESGKVDIQMDVSPVLELLRQKIGLNPESIGTASVEKAVRECIEMSGSDSVEDYVKKVNWSAKELNKLVESVVVQETSFFRNRTPFITLQKYIQQFVLNKKRESPLRILCVPCSTGEEAYSIAMVLFDMRLSANQFYIFAGDISEPVLQFAEAGRYSPYSFRGKDIAFRKKYFSKQTDGAYLLNKDVRDAVHFERVNVLSENFLQGHKPYDVIFCRNLLIYFDDAAKEKTIGVLAGHLDKEGIMFVGHAEGANIAHFGLASLDYPMSFVFARKDRASIINDALNINNPAKKSSSPPVPVKRKVAKAGQVSDARKSTPVSTEPVKPFEKEQTTVKSLADREISKARQLADAGAFGEVVALCERLLSEGVESAEIYYLLGQAAGSTGDNLLAEEYIKKAIYLDADFYDALIYLSILFDRMNNREKAASFRKRAQRVRLRKKVAEEQ